MTITVKFYERDPYELEPDYSRPHEQKFTAKTAEECMTQFFEFKQYLDIALYTVPYINNVED